MCRIGLFALFLASSVCLIAVGTTQAAVIYSENFDGGTNGQSILDPPYLYTANFGELGSPAYPVNDATPIGSGLAVNGAINTSGLSLAYHDITGPTGTAGTIYTLTATLWAPDTGTANGTTNGRNDSFIGLAKPDKNGGLSFNNAGLYIGYSRAAPDPKARWRFDARGVRTNAEADVITMGESGDLGEKVVTATIKIDIDTNTVTGTVTDGVTTLTSNFVGGNDFSNITRFVIQERFNGLDVDNVLIQEGSAAVPGDFDGDGDVDGADFVAWQTNFPKATGATLAEGDADGDGDVDGADFVVWQTNFPFTPAAATSSVPEPMSLVLAMMGTLLVLTQRGRRR